MQKILNVYKPVGLTPLEIINRIRENKPTLVQTKVCYAGRLDPLAHGVLLLVTGEKIKQVTPYLNLTKEYEFAVALGVQTDTYDLLGFVKENSIHENVRNVTLFVNTFVNKFIGLHKQVYPPYSSKTVLGKPLFWWARNNKLSEIEIPTRSIEIYDFRCTAMQEIAVEALRRRIEETVSLVHGDFRQQECIKRWGKLFKRTNGLKSLPTLTFSIRCSSGTYIRELINQLGKQLGCGAVAIEILRTKVGNFSLSDAISV